VLLFFRVTGEFWPVVMVIYGVYGLVTLILGVYLACRMMRMMMMYLSLCLWMTMTLMILLSHILLAC